MVKVGDALMQKRASGIKLKVGVMKEGCWVKDIVKIISCACAQCCMDTFEVGITSWHSSTKPADW